MPPVRWQRVQTGGARVSYQHIDNLYKDTRILAFKVVYAMEKIHGTLAHLCWKDGVVGYFSGGVKHANFVVLFDEADLVRRFVEVGHADVTVYGEAYGGKCQGMSKMYGPDLKFVAFEVKVGNCWLAVPDAHQVASGLGLEFVDYSEVPTNMDAIDASRDAPSVQAMRNGMGVQLREGIVLRPPFEVTLNNGKRLVAKHKSDAFKERQKQPKVGEPSEVLAAANAIAQEWVTPMRLTHVLDGLAVDGLPPGIDRTKDVILAMIADVEREAAGEVEMSKQARKSIGSRTAQMFKARLQEGLYK